MLVFGNPLLGDTLEMVMKKDVDYIFIRHTLRAEEETTLHYHPEANEWLAVEKGDFIVRCGDEEREFDSKDSKTSNWAHIVSLPQGKAHSLRAVTDLSYFVLRDKEDETIEGG